MMITGRIVTRRVYQFVIYGLREPGTRWIRYVGKSNNHRLRLKAHRATAWRRGCNPRLTEWIREMASRGVEVEMVVLARLKVGAHQGRGYFDFESASELTVIRTIAGMNNREGGPILFNVAGNRFAKQQSN